MIDESEAQLKRARAALRKHVAEGTALMKRVDSVMDGLYGPDGPKKASFGLPPKKVRHKKSLGLDEGEEGQAGWYG